MISGYFDQQRAALAAVQEDTSRGGYLSNADQVAERRKTSRLYLSFYVIVVALVAGGLVLLAHGAGYIDAGGSFATWLALTGGVALLLGWRRHGDEFAHSPEGIARHLADWHGSVAQYEAETRRKSIRWEYQAEATPAGASGGSGRGPQTSGAAHCGDRGPPSCGRSAARSA